MIYKTLHRNLNIEQHERWTHEPRNRKGKHFVCGPANSFMFFSDKNTNKRTPPKEKKKKQLRKNKVKLNGSSTDYRIYRT